MLSRAMNVNIARRVLGVLAWCPILLLLGCDSTDVDDKPPVVAKAETNPDVVEQGNSQTEDALEADSVQPSKAAEMATDSVDAESIEPTTETDNTVADSDHPQLDSDPPPTDPAPAAISPPNNPPKLDAPPFRLFCPTEAGPMIVDLDIRVDDVPLAVAFKKRLVQVMSDANADGSDDVSWNELYDHVSGDTLTFGRNAANLGQRRNMTQLYDRNRNRRVELDELTNFVFRDAGLRVPFRLQGTDYFRDRQRHSQTFGILDRDGDETLDVDEIQRATESLLRYDRNGDQRLAMNEVVDQAANDAMGMNQNSDPAWNRRRVTRDGNVATDLNGYVDWTLASYALGELSQPELERPFAMTNNPFADLDENENGAVSVAEAKRILERDPDIIVTANLSASLSEPPTLSVLWQREELQPYVLSTGMNDRLSIADDRLHFAVHIADRRGAQVQFPDEAFALLDANNDGGLDETEVPDQFKQQYPFEDFDADEDGKLTLDEIRNRLLPKPPIWNVQVRGRGAELPDALFGFLDSNSDQSLSTREIHEASSRLKEMSDQGGLSSEDIPSTFLIQLVRGDPEQRNQLFSFDALRATGPTNTADAPTWATGMDTNGDQEISSAEFIGSQDQFRKLDSNGDGFIDFTEASNSEQS